jgi:hypothetical protein
MKLNSPPAAIEGKKIQLRGQDIKSGTPPIKIGEIVLFPVHLYQQGTGTILEESNPKISIVRIYSMLNKDDEISGKKLWGLSSAPLKRLNVGDLGRTSSHPGQDQIINGNLCYLEIIEGWRGLPLTRHPRDEILSLAL